MYSYTKPYEQKKLEDICFYSTMTHSSNNKQSREIDQRLLRHSVLIYLPSPDDQALRSIFNGVLEASLTHPFDQSIDAELHHSLIEASVKLLGHINEVLRPCPTPGRQHYLFNMKTVITILQGLRKLSETQRQDNVFVVSLWKHEVRCSIDSQLPRYSDSYWLQATVDDLIKEHFAGYIGEDAKLIEEFVCFDLEPRSYDRPLTGGVQNSVVKVSLSPVDSLETVRGYIEQVFNRYKEEFGYHSINIFLSINAAYHLMRIHRVLSLPQWYV